MKTGRLLLTVTVLMSIILIGCSGTGGNPATLKGHLKISGSTALKPLMDAATKSFKEEHPNVSFEIVGNGSRKGIEDVTKGTSQIGNSDIYADPAAYPDPKLTDHIVGVIPFAMIVHPGVNVKSLTTEQIKKIFSTGEINNWSQVGGEDLAITPIVRPATSGTRSTFRTYILEGLDEKAGKLLPKDSSDDVLNAVASTPGAIGYLALSVVKAPVKTIAIDKVEASEQTITSGKYRFWSYAHMYTLGNNTPLLETFMNFMLDSNTVQQHIKNLGYIPTQAMNLPKASEASYGA